MMDAKQGTSIVHKKSNNAYCDSGNIVAIAGADYVIIGADTLLTKGFLILSREVKRLLPLSDVMVLGTVGSGADALALTGKVQECIHMYKLDHNMTISMLAATMIISSMLDNTNVPYHVYSVLAGLDERGKGCIVRIDPEGNYQQLNYHAEGSAMKLMQPLLDHQVGKKKNLVKENAIELLKDAFICASERHICTGDNIYIKIITETGTKEEKFALRKN